MTTGVHGDLAIRLVTRSVMPGVETIKLRTSSRNGLILAERQAELALTDRRRLANLLPAAAGPSKSWRQTRPIFAQHQGEYSMLSLGEETIYWIEQRP